MPPDHADGMARMDGAKASTCCAVFIPVLLLLAASCAAEAGEQGRQLSGANSFLQQGDGKMLLKSNTVVLDASRGAPGTAKRGARRERERRSALSMLHAVPDVCVPSFRKRGPGREREGLGEGGSRGRGRRDSSQPRVAKGGHAQVA
jgi:hypothetical protein